MIRHIIEMASENIFILLSEESLNQILVIVSLLV